MLAMRHDSGFNLKPTRAGKETLVGRLNSRCHTRLRRPDTSERDIYTRSAANVTKAYRYYYNRMVNVLAGQVVKDGCLCGGQHLGWME